MQSIEAVAAERSGTTPIRDGHLSSGAVLCRGWSGRYCDGAGQSRAGFGAIFRAVTLKHWKFQSEGVVWSSSRKPELQSGQRRTTSFCGTLTMRLQRQHQNDEDGDPIDASNFFFFFFFSFLFLYPSNRERIKKEFECFFCWSFSWLRNRRG